METEPPVRCTSCNRIKDPSVEDEFCEPCRVVEDAFWERLSAPKPDAHPGPAALTSNRTPSWRRGR